MKSISFRSMAIISMAVILCVSGNALAVLSGAGTQANPYLIQSRADFDAFANPANAATYWASGVYTRLMYDPNLAGTIYTRAVIAPDTDNGPGNGFQGTQFAGVFDGSGHTISSLTIAAPDQEYVGLFGFVSGQVKNLGIVNADIQGRYYVGLLAGAYSGPVLNDCYASGSVRGTGILGGLVGQIYGSALANCHSTSSVTGSTPDGSLWGDVGGLVGGNTGGTMGHCYASGSAKGTGIQQWVQVGGLVGSSYNGTMDDCYATGSATGPCAGGLIGASYDDTLISCHSTGSVSGTIWIGGLLGWNAKDTLIQCYATGPVSGGTEADWAEVGGLVGETSEGTVTSCYATGSVQGAGWVGGLVGYNYACALTNCYATGSVTGTQIYIGGLVADHRVSAITNCYATGAVNGPVNTWVYVGGLVGFLYSGSASSCFWDTQTSGKTLGVGHGASTGITGKSTADMKKLATFTGGGWDFTNETANGTNDYWRMCVNGLNYPRLSWQYGKGDLACPDGVAFDDMAVVAQKWLLSCSITNNYCGLADIDRSGSVNFRDYAVLAANWLQP